MTANKGKEGAISGNGDSGNREEPKFKVSFRDKVVGNHEPKLKEAFNSLTREKLGTVKGKQGDALPPCISFFEEGKKILSEPYFGAIVIKLLGKHISFTALSYRLKGLWKLKGGYDIIAVGSGYFLIKCELEEDRNKILLGGPWKLNGFYLAVKEWTTEFKPSEESFGTTLVWIRISGMNILYYQQQAMELIASGVGNPIRVDLATKGAEKCRYARACVEVDLSLPAVTEVIIDGSTYKVIYEDLEFLCEHCKCFGHIKQDCKLVKQEERKAAEESTQEQQPPMTQSGMGDIETKLQSPDVKLHELQELPCNQPINGDEGDWTEVSYNKRKPSKKKIVQNLKQGRTSTSSKLGKMGSLEMFTMTK